MDDSMTSRIWRWRPVSTAIPVSLSSASGMDAGLTVLAFGWEIKHLFDKRAFDSRLDSERTFVVRWPRTGVRPCEWPPNVLDQLTINPMSMNSMSMRSSAMAVIAYDTTMPRYASPRRPTATAYRRRRVAVLLAAVVAILLAA